MRESYWGYWLVILGVFIIGVMLLVNNISTTNTNDYYNIKEVTQAAMIDAVDYSYYRLYGSVKMSEQKFVENFIRRFAENVNPSNTYKIDFYDLYEVPPKVSVKISTNSSSFNVGNSLSNSYDVTNTLTAILELGVSDGSDKPINNTDSKTCEVFAYSSLMQFFQDGKKVAGLDGKEYNYSTSGISFDSRLHEAAESNDISKFRQTLADVYQSSFNKRFDQWDDSLVFLYHQGWLRVTF